MKRKNKGRWGQAWLQAVQATAVSKWLLGGLITAAILAILLIGALPAGVQIEVGEVAKQDIVAPITAINSGETERLKEEAARQALREAADDPSFYQINPAVVLGVEEDVTGVLNLLRQGIAPEDAGDAEQPEQLNISEIDRRLIRDWQIEIPQRNLEAVVSLSLAEFDRFAQITAELVLAAMEERISEDGLRDARDAFEESVKRSGLRDDLEQAAVVLGRQLIRPNLVLDTERVQEAVAQAEQAVQPVQIIQGEIIIRKGDVVRPEHISLMRDVGLLKTGRDYGAAAGRTLLVLAVVALMGVYLRQNRLQVLENPAHMGLVGSVVVTVLLLGRLFSMLAWPEAVYLNPSALVGLLLTLLLDPKVATMATVVTAVLLGVISDFSWAVGILALVGGLTAVLSVSKVSQRGDLMRAGSIVGGVNVLLMVALGLVGKDSGLLIHSYLGLLSGVLASIVAIGVLPYLESAFKITSPIRLLELSNPNHPLLRRLMLEAPGTYHHSILVGNLAEAAAEAVGADGLLARVGSHYHDIGKLKRPYFFVENQVGKDNPHDKMAPSLSTLIVTSHVKDGLELASEYKLPDVVTQFIAQHHGTDLVRFFYHRATEASEDSSVEEKDFRYPGPKPQGKEVAIVSLADAVEAAVRSLTKPTPGKIEGLVRKIIKDRLNSGQLDESDLTFQDMDRIANAFVKVIMGMFHTRVEYPEKITKEEIEGKKGKNGSPLQ
ncbi:HD family phosphohydrolase [Candidatus Darwinibacter acetoxidans]|nr:HDIG domain-containing protein [Limnochordia bacterium]HOK31216.1 HDIG domain-containing protein [Limnochordia bacterium]HOM00070.1 HDIG domain-containing protein [Limnochordia bacterium]HPP71582.1 HDIG domain-containing protein [Limnochordia bacterium]HPZ79435.1 HDIG domain-containing protein [Limnochordia bacterium]